MRLLPIADDSSFSQYQRTKDPRRSINGVVSTTNTSSMSVDSIFISRTIGARLYVRPRYTAQAASGFRLCPVRDRPDTTGRWPLLPPEATRPTSIRERFSPSRCRGKGGLLRGYGGGRLYST